MKTAVVLFNLGGPTSKKEIKTFLFNIFYDPHIIGIPNPFRFLLAKFISRVRHKKAKKIYSYLGGTSPLYENTLQQGKALEKELGDTYKVFIAMRHAQPQTDDAIKKILNYKPDQVLLLPLYPQYSFTTTQSSFDEWKTKKQKFNLKIPTRYVCCYPENRGFIKSIVSNMGRVMKGTPSEKIIFTAHGLPQNIINKGDPYQKQVEATVSAIVKSLMYKPLNYILSYQSRVGRGVWLTPYTEDEIIKASKEKKDIIIVPLSFVSENSETLVELDIFYKNLALTNGANSYTRVSTVGCSEEFISSLAILVKVGKKCKNCFLIRDGKRGFEYCND